MSDSSKNSVYLKNIAQKAGVSVGTVSLVLNGKGDKMRISKSTQGKINKIASELNYTPTSKRQNKSSLSVNQDYRIGLFWNLESIDWFIGSFVRYLYLASEESNLEMDITVQPYAPGGLNRLEGKINTHRFSGIIIANASDSDLTFLKDNDFDVPIVVLNRETGKYCNVSENDYEAGKACAKLFADNGHKNVGIIGMKRTSLASRLKTMGFKDGCAENNITVKDDWIMEDTRANFEGGYEMTKKLLRQKEHPTALFVMYHYLALGAVSASKDLGFNIPEDISVIAYGMNSAFEHYSPTISSFNVTSEELAESSLNMLLLLIKHDLNAVVNKNLSPHFFFRESCKSVKQ